MNRILLIDTGDEDTIAFDASTFEQMDSACKTALSMLIERDCLEPGPEPLYDEATKHLRRRWQDRVTILEEAKRIISSEEKLFSIEQNAILPQSLDILKMASRGFQKINVINLTQPR